MRGSWRIHPDLFLWLQRSINKTCERKFNIAKNTRWQLGSATPPNEWSYFVVPRNANWAPIIPRYQRQQQKAKKEEEDWRLDRCVQQSSTLYFSCLFFLLVISEGFGEKFLPEVRCYAPVGPKLIQPQLQQHGPFKNPGNSICAAAAPLRGRISRNWCLSFWD